MQTQQLIRALSADSAVRWAFDRRIAIAVVLAILVAAGIFFAAIGFRPDISEAVTTPRFIFKFVVTLSVATAASALLVRLGRPGATLGYRALALAIAPALLVLATLIELVAVPHSLWISKLMGSNARLCLTLIPILAIGPLACFLVVLRQGASTRPGASGAIAGIAASGIAATFYAANCTDDSPLFVVVWYSLATAIMAAAGFWSGRRFLTW